MVRLLDFGMKSLASRRSRRGCNGRLGIVSVPESLRDLALMRSSGLRRTLSVLTLLAVSILLLMFRRPPAAS